MSGKKFEMAEGEFTENTLAGGFVEEDEELIEVTEIHEDESHSEDDTFQEIEETETILKKKVVKKKEPKAKAPKIEGENKNIPLIIGGVFVLGIVGFISWLVLSTYNDMKTVTSPVATEQATFIGEVKTDPDIESPASSFVTGAVSENNLAKEYNAPQEPKADENGYGVPPTEGQKQKEDAWGASAPTVEQAPVAMEETGVDDLYVAESSSPVSAVEEEMMGTATKDGAFEHNQGGVCDLSVKFKPSISYVYYVLEGETYVPAFKKKDWDGRGVLVEQRVVTLSYDNINKFTEVEEGKFIPSEMFSKCSAFDKK